VIDGADQCFSHALLALANPHGSTFAQMRNSGVVSIQALKQISDESPIERIQQATKSINETVARIRKLTASAAS
jgi:acetylornithine/succinyldiaminopimelate/putrescine aminotransferase